MRFFGNFFDQSRFESEEVSEPGIISFNSLNIAAAAVTQLCVTFVRSCASMVWIRQHGCTNINKTRNISHVLLTENQKAVDHLCF